MVQTRAYNNNPHLLLRIPGSTGNWFTVFAVDVSAGFKEDKILGPY